MVLWWFAQQWPTVLPDDRHGPPHIAQQLAVVLVECAHVPRKMAAEIGCSDQTSIGVKQMHDSPVQPGVH